MHRYARALAAAIVLMLLTAVAAVAAGPPFPDPVEDQSVYDTADILAPETEAELESIIDAAEARTGAEMVVYTQFSGFISEDENLENARALVDQWGIGRSGFDDSLVLMIGVQQELVGKVSLFGGAGFIDAYAGESELDSIVDDVFIPLANDGDMDEAALATMREVDSLITPGGSERVEEAAVVAVARQAMSTISEAPWLVGASIFVLGASALVWNKWRQSRRPW
ncbi:MAG TPA: TPM domain-containing protein [Candidatus Limnocylindria bacterium]|jgi:uncharacterized membrane protein YgcG